MTRGPLLLLLGGAVGALAPSWARVPVLLYAPLTRTFRIGLLGSSGSVVEITFYGIYLCAAIGALVGGAIGSAWDRRVGNASAPLVTAWALTALAIATAYQLWSVWP